MTGKLCLGCRMGPSHSQEQEEQEEQEEVEEGNRPHRPGVDRRVEPHRFEKLAVVVGNLQRQHRLQLFSKKKNTKLDLRLKCITSPLLVSVCAQLLHPNRKLPQHRILLVGKTSVLLRGHL